MKRIFVLLPLLLVLSSARAQNPIIKTHYTADPTARVFNGRLYLFCSHDIINPDNPERRWFAMEDYRMYSSDNLTDWTDHGVILSQNQVPWGNPSAYSMWAPDCVLKDGKYYFFFPDNPNGVMGFGIGVAVSDNIDCPSFISQKESIKGIMGIDPCVLQTSDGDSYIFWSGMGGLRVAKLKANMLEIEDTDLQEGGTSIEGLPDGFKEGPFAFEHDGRFYLSYPWVRTEGGTECLAYAVSDSPRGPYQYKGIIMSEWPDKCWTNHHSIVNFKGQWYLFYHHNDYSPSFDKNRSVRIDSLSFNADGTINEVIPSLRGVGVTDCSSQIQLDRYSRLEGGASIAYNDTTDFFRGWKCIIPPGGTVYYSSVDISFEDYFVWVCMPDFWGRSKVVDIKETQLNLSVCKQSDGYYTLALKNNGPDIAQVDWISLSPRRPLVPAASGGMSTGVYRNIFVEAGYDSDKVEARLNQVFNEVFSGKNRCYFEAGKDMAYISDIKNDDVRTEGMSYGMMIAVQFDRKDIFDRLWRWAKKYMQLQDGPFKGYFRWSCKRDGTPNSMGPASDGELYFITSLIFASNLWGDNGEFNYLKEAQMLLDIIQPREVEFMGTTHTISLIDSQTRLITFVPGAPFTDPSYHIPAYYEVWARYAHDGRASFWWDCAQKSREYLHRSINPLNGLNPDYNNFDGSLLNNDNLIGDAFRYDSWRVPMNIALDYSWSCSDPDWQSRYGETFQNFLYGFGADDFPDQFEIDGSKPEKILRAGNFPEKLRHSPGLVATSAAASILCSHYKSYEFIDRLWNSRNIKDSDGYFDAYYDGLLRLFAFMHLSGHYRVIGKVPQMESYFKAASSSSASPDSEGFVRRWSLRDPITKENRSNTVFTDSYLNSTFPEPISIKDKKFHTFDSQAYNIKLYRFATCTNKQRYGVIFWVTTTIECENDISDVRFCIGSNSASKWWLDSKEIALLSGDRRMVRDDFVTCPLNLHKGSNVIVGAVINGPGMSDFCFRLTDKNGLPLTDVMIK